MAAERPTQADCQYEPGYPDHETVVCSIRYPGIVCHLAVNACPTEGPHEWHECGYQTPETGTNDG